MEYEIRGGSRTTSTSKMELFVIMVKDFQHSTILTKCSILDDAVVLDPHLQISYKSALQKEQAPRTFLVSSEANPLGCHFFDFYEEGVVDQSTNTHNVRLDSSNF